MINKSPNLTNQELLRDLKARLPNFTYDELYFLLAIIQPYQERVLKIIQDYSKLWKSPELTQI